MAAETAIKQAAIEIANDIKQRSFELEKELAKVEMRKSEIEASLQLVHLSHDRLFKFKPKVWRDFRCPRCWVRDGIDSNLVPISGTATLDFFSCKRCQFEISVME